MTRALAVFVLLAACSAKEATRPGGASALPYVEITTGGAGLEDERLPLVLALHGYGDSPRAFVHVYAGLRARARVIAVQAPLSEGAGFAWFPLTHGRGGIRFEPDDVGRAIPRILATLEAVRVRRGVRGRPVVTGFSQGGMLTYQLALREGAAFEAAFPVAGLAITDEAEGHAAPIVAFHGTADDVVPYDADRRSVDALRARGHDVTLRSYPGVGHTVTDVMRRDVLAAIEAALR